MNSILSSSIIRTISLFLTSTMGVPADSVPHVETAFVARLENVGAVR